MPVPCTINLDNESCSHITSFVQKYPFFKKSGLLAVGLQIVISYYEKTGRLPSVDDLSWNPTTDLAPEAAALPGLTREVIASHLVRFPAVTPDRYREVIGELLRRQASPDGLKNAEAAAYGLCKQIQAGKAITKASPAPALAATAAPAAPTTTDNGDEVPAEFTAPY